MSETDDIVHVCFCEVFISAKKLVCLTLNVWKWVFVIHEYYAWILLIAIIDNNKFESIVTSHVELMKLSHCVHCEYIDVARSRKDDFAL